MSRRRDFSLLAGVFDRSKNRGADTSTALEAVFAYDAMSNRAAAEPSERAAEIALRVRTDVRRDSLRAHRRTAIQMHLPLLQEVAVVHGYQASDLTSRTRHPAVSAARHEACWRLRRRNVSYHDAAACLGFANHTSAIYAERKFEQRLATEPALRARVLGAAA